MNETDWYLLDRGGRRYGPYDLEFVEQLVERHEVLEDTRVWNPGLPHWRRADQVLNVAVAARVLGSAGAQSMSVQVKATPSAHIKSADQPRVLSAPISRPPPARTAQPRVAAVPAALRTLSIVNVWQRVLSGLFDLLLLAVLLRALAKYVLPDAAHWLTSLPLLLVVWAAADAWLLANVGFTPGKALLAVTIRGNDGAKLEPKRALLRAGALPLGLLLFSTFGWFFGFFGLILLAVSWQRLQAGRGLWPDELAESQVSYGELPEPRRFAVAIGFVLLLAAGAWLRR